MEEEEEEELLFKPDVFESAVENSGRSFKIGEINVDGASPTSEKFRMVRKHLMLLEFDAVVLTEFYYLFGDFEVFKESEIVDVELGSVGSFSSGGVRRRERA